MTKQNSLLRSIIAIGVLSLFVIYHVIVTHYTHLHVVEGYLIAHVHPFSDSPGTTHSHTQQEFAFLDTLLLRAALPLFFFFSILVAFSLLKKVIPFIVGEVRRFILHIFCYRGPPVGF